MSCLTLMLAAALALPTAPLARSAIFTSPLPACDALGLADEEGEVAARDLDSEGEPMTPAAGFDTRDCELPDKAPAVIDCNDTRANVWVHEMIGTCDMPVVYPHASLHPQPPRDRSRELDTWCNGHSCSRDSVPLRSRSPGGDQPNWLALAAPAPPIGWPCRRLAPSRDVEPESALLRRADRPPRG